MKFPVRVENVHIRDIAAPAHAVGALIDALASADDRLWPFEKWPRMRLDRPLSVGAAGGHGPIRYVVEDYSPGSAIRFRFTAPRGFIGYHSFMVEEVSGSRTRLRHDLAMRVVGAAIVTWPFAFRALHDALIEDAFDKAERELTGTVARPCVWSFRVRLLREALRQLGMGKRN